MWNSVIVRRTMVGHCYLRRLPLIHPHTPSTDRRFWPCQSQSCSRNSQFHTLTRSCTHRIVFSVRAFSTTTTKDPRIQARPPNEPTTIDDSDSKFPLPDKDKEQELAALQNQVRDLYQAGNYRKALNVSQTLLKHCQDHFGINHPATAAAYNNVGLQYKQIGNFDESRKSYQTAKRIYQQTVGNDHASYAATLHNLGTLHRTQVHLDTTLRAMDRLSFMEESVTLLQQAYEIRKVELGEHHAHTVASRSSWGATLASQILHHYKMTTPTNKNKKNNNNNNNNKDTASSLSSKQEDDIVTEKQQRLYVSLLPKDLAQQGWEAAQDHLEQAYQTAMENPRGPSIAKKQPKQGVGKRQRRKHTNNNTNNTKDRDSTNLEQIQTLSAASAGQNLAVFLKARATTEELDEPSRTALLQRAKNLYTQVLTVRMQLLPATHPDLYATKHSLAEVLHVMGDEEAANAIRQEIVDSYEPDENTAVKSTKSTQTENTV